MQGLDSVRGNASQEEPIMPKCCFSTINLELSCPACAGSNSHLCQDRPQLLCVPPANVTPPTLLLAPPTLHTHQPLNQQTQGAADTKGDN
jgi:hypothetical protein